MIILRDEEYDVTVFGDTLEETVAKYENDYDHSPINELIFYKAEEVQVKRKLEFL